MKQERKRKARLALWTLVFAAAAAAALLLCRQLKTSVKPAWEGGYTVHISEVMTDNTACPNAEGLLWDYVEIENTSDRAFDLGGYYLSDTPGEGKYAFPAGTAVPPNGCLAVWCARDAEGEGYAPFGLRKEGGETVALMNASLVSVDEVLTVPCAPGQALLRGEDGALIPGTPSPGFPNTEAGVQSWQAVLASRSGGTLELSEVMTSNSLYAAPDGAFCDWVELRNPTDRPVSLSGYKLSDREEKTKFDLPADRSLGPGEVLVIWCVPGGSGELTAPFGLSSKGGETMVLTGPNGTAADSVTLPELAKNSSYIKENGGWTVSAAPTPGYPNDEAGLAAYRASLGYEDVSVYISEIMNGNKACCVDEDGDFSDWFELWNAGTQAVDLSGWYLSDTEEEPDKWPIPGLVLQPGEYLRIWASGKNRSTPGSLHAGFAVSAGESLCLVSPNGVILRSVTVEGLDGFSQAMRADGSWFESDYPSPGFGNDAAGWTAFCEQDGRAAAVLLWEITVSDPDHDDWVELKNVSDGPVDLSGYSLTDRKNDPARMTLTEGVLAPGESRVIEVQNFGLSSQRDEVYLFAPDGRVCDFARLHHIPPAGSYGRMEGQNGFFYFAAKTPGADNGQGWRLVTEDPAPDVAPGVYDGVDSLTVSLTGERIFYTTDGTEPDANAQLYTGPITLTETTVLRVIDLGEGRLPGKCATYSYFINENSSLPIVSLVTAPDSLFGRTGIYDHHEEAWQGNWEREASVEFYEDGGSFQIDCGIQIHGRTSRRASDKRSFKLKFRSRYGGDLHYDVFGDGRVVDFSSLLLRGSLEDNYSSYMRDELFAAIAMENTDVPAQNYRYVSLYINGEYWGIYAIREHHSEDYFASHYGVDADSVDMQTGEFYGTTAWNSLVKYAEANPGAWEYMKEHVDIPEMIDWLIIECWSGDFDVYENVRFYGSPQYKDGRYIYGLVDMDLTMMQHDTYEVGFSRFGQIHMIIPNSLLGVPEFRDMFLTRLGEMLRGPLSEEAVTAKIAQLRSIVEPESQRDLQRWGKDLSTFTSQMSNIQNFVDGRNDEMRNSAVGFFGLSADQAARYFG